MSGPAVWLLDVDGVLNANRPGWGEAPRRTTAYCNGLAWRLRWAPKLIHAILTLRQELEPDIRWATTWINEIREVETAMRLPAFPCIPWGEEGLPQERKIAAALAVLESGCPLVWTDDDAIPLPGEAGWHPLFDADSPPRLFIAPKSNRGLQPADLQRIGEFLASTRSSSDHLE